MAVDNIEQIFAEIDLMDRTRPEPPTLSDMPNEILGEIVGNLDFMDRLVVRKVSQYLRNATDKTKPEVEQVSVVFHDDSTFLQYEYCNPNIVKYIQMNDKCLVQYGKRKHVIEGGDHVKLAINDMAIVMKNPKHQLEEIGVNLQSFDQSTVEQYSQHLKSFLESLTHQIHTEYVVIAPFLDAAKSILPYLKPGTLKSISLFCRDGYNQTMKTMEKIGNLEQWKQATYLTCAHLNPLVSIEHVLNFNRLDIELQSISLQDMIKTRDVLFKSPHFVSAVIVLSEDCNVDDMRRIFESDIPRHPNGSIDYKVPNSDNAFRVFILLSRIEINKIVL